MAHAGRRTRDREGRRSGRSATRWPALIFASDPGARPVAQDLITAVGLRPEYVGDADAAGIVDSLLPLWMALVREQGGNRKLALRVLTG